LRGVLLWSLGYCVGRKGWAQVPLILNAMAIP
jgi:hypothetical protein